MEISKQGERLPTTIPVLDEALGGGLLAGSLTLIIGASGAGKTQLGIHWCGGTARSDECENSLGAILDFSGRGDSQHHRNYAQRICGWQMIDQPMQKPSIQQIFDLSHPVGHRLEVIGYDGQRAVRNQMDPDAWDAWTSRWNATTPTLAAFLYQHLIRGTRKFLIDGIEPTDHPQDSTQWEMIELIYHKMIRRSHDWLAREVFRQDFHLNRPNVEANAYPDDKSTVVVLVTSRESLLEQLIQRPWSDGDIAAGANTILLMGRTQLGTRMGRGLFIAKHRGSYCSDSILNFSIGERGLVFE